MSLYLNSNLEELRDEVIKNISGKSVLSEITASAKAL